MAMQICVLSDERLDSIAEWQKSIDTEGFSLQLSDAQPESNLAAHLCNDETSIEYDVHNFSELKDAYRQINFGHDWKYAVAFTWSSDFAEEIAAWMAATAYARATSGVIFDEQEGKIFTPEEAHRIACDSQRRRPATEAMLRNYIGQLSAKSPEAEAALRAFVRKRLK